MELLGLNPVLLLAQLVSFSVLFIVLKKFLYSSIRKSLNERAKKIKEISEGTALIDKKLQQLEEEKEEMKKKNQEELQKLIAETQKDAEEIKKEIIEQADERGKKMIEDATKRIEQEKEKASEILKHEAGQLAAALAAKILSTSSNSTKVVDDSIKELERVAAKKK